MTNRSIVLTCAAAALLLGLRDCALMGCYGDPVAAPSPTVGQCCFVDHQGQPDDSCRAVVYPPEEATTDPSRCVAGERLFPLGAFSNKVTGTCLQWGRWTDLVCVVTPADLCVEHAAHGAEWCEYIGGRWLR